VDGINRDGYRSDPLKEIKVAKDMEKMPKDMEQEEMLKSIYSFGSEIPDEKFLEAALNFFSKIRNPSFSLESILKEILEFVRSNSPFQECLIGLKDKDGLFRFKAMIGFTDEAAAEIRNIVFTQDDMKSIRSYHPINICKFSQFHLSERRPYAPGMEKAFNKPDLLKSTRAHPDDMIEGDFIEIDLRDKSRDIIGWMELSGTVDGKLPQRDTIMRIEFFASCIIPIIVMKT